MTSIDGTTDFSRALQDMQRKTAANFQTRKKLIAARGSVFKAAACVN